MTVSNSSDRSPGPLSHLTIVEMAGIGPGPFAAMLFADLGAKVIRVDRIPDANATTFGSMARKPSIVDRGRQSIAVDMKQPAGLAVVLSLVAQAAGLIEGYRPGVMERLGLRPKVCHERNPRLVYGRMTGWGQHGPLAQVAGHDINYLALSGALHAMGAKDRPPAPPLSLVGDYGGGMLLAFGMLAALLEVRQSGCGQVVDAAMTDGAALLMAAPFGLLANGAWHDARESNFLDGAAHFYRTYECADGKYVSIGPIEQPFYERLLKLCGIDDPAFNAQWEQSRWPELRGKLEAVFRTRSQARWCELLEGTDACFAPVLSMGEAPLHHHNQARGTFVEAHGVTQPAPAPRFDRTPAALPSKAPLAGEHTRAILRNLAGVMMNRPRCCKRAPCTTPVTEARLEGG